MAEGLLKVALTSWYTSESILNAFFEMRQKWTVLKVDGRVESNFNRIFSTSTSRKAFGIWWPLKRPTISRRPWSIFEMVAWCRSSKENCSSKTSLVVEFNSIHFLCCSINNKYFYWKILISSWFVTSFKLSVHFFLEKISSFLKILFEKF